MLAPIIKAQEAKISTVYPLVASCILMRLDTYFI